MQVLQKARSNPFGTSRIAFFGYDSFSAAENMAIDEILKEKADKEDRFFIRFYNVGKPSVILGAEDHYDVIKGSASDCDVSRRITGGRPIYLDDNTLQYSICGPLHDERHPYKGFGRYIHKTFGAILADSLSEIIEEGHEITLPRSSSVRIDGKPIAGHGESITWNHSFLYHGVIVMKPWDLERIDALLHIDRSDFDELGTLPNVTDLTARRGIQVGKDGLVGRMLMKLPAGQLTAIEDADRASILGEAASLAEGKYSSMKWIYRSDIQLRRDTKFCILYEA